jgi:hypothetical protein
VKISGWYHPAKVTSRAESKMGERMRLLTFTFAVLAAVVSTVNAQSKPVWDKWHLDIAFDRYPDWLVVADPSGSCYMLQSYGASVPDLIIRNDDSVNLNGVGLYDSITYQVGTGNKFTIHNPGNRSLGYVVLPDASIKVLKLASTLTVTIHYQTGQTKQAYSLAGFAKAYDGMKRCILANDPP